MNVERWVARNLQRNADESLRALVEQQLRQDWFMPGTKRYFLGVIEKIEARDRERREQAWQDAKASWFQT